MDISSSDLEYAVLKIFADLRIPMNGKLGHATLVKEWSKLHLRYTDLSDAIRRLIRLDVLKQEHSRDDDLLQLTQCGFTRAMDLRRHDLKHWLRKKRLGLLLMFSRSLNSARGHHRYSH